jgi:hypothetical protein
LVYRSALKEILGKYNKAGVVLTSSEARDIVNDIISPQVSKLRFEAVATRRSLLKKSVAKATVPVAMVSLEVIGGLIPHELAKIFEWGATRERDIDAHHFFTLALMCHGPAKRATKSLEWLESHSAA